MHDNNLVLAIICHWLFVLNVIRETGLYSGGFRGGSGGSPEPPSGAKLFHFHGEIYEKSGKMLKTNPLSMYLNPPFRNPGSAPVCISLMASF